MATFRYPVRIEALSPAEGGGFVAFAPNLPGCMSDGETPADALRTIEDAIAEWLETAAELNRPIPEPTKSLDFV